MYCRAVTLALGEGSALESTRLPSSRLHILTDPSADPEIRWILVLARHNTSPEGQRFEHQAIGNCNISGIIDGYSVDIEDLYSSSYAVMQLIVGIKARLSVQRRA